MKVDHTTLSKDDFLEPKKIECKGDIIFLTTSAGQERCIINAITEENQLDTKSSISNISPNYQYHINININTINISNTRRER